jgi:hypothetical protein
VTVIVIFAISSCDRFLWIHAIRLLVRNRRSSATFPTSFVIDKSAS